MILTTLTATWRRFFYAKGLVFSFLMTFSLGRAQEKNQLPLRSDEPVLTFEAISPQDTRKTPVITVTVHNLHENPFVLTDVEMSLTPPTGHKHIRTTIPPHGKIILRLVVPDEVIPEKDPHVVLQPTILGFFIQSGTERKEFRLNLPTVSFVQRYLFRLACSAREEEAEELFEVESEEPNTFSFDSLLPTYKSLETFHCKNPTPFPINIRVQIEEEAKNQKFHFALPSAPVTGWNRSIPPGGTFSFQVRYQAGQEPADHTALLNIQATPPQANDAVDEHTIKINLVGTTLNQVHPQAGNDKPRVSIQWHTANQAKAACPHYKEDFFATNETSLDFGTLFDGDSQKMYQSQGVCLAAIRVYPSQDECSAKTRVSLENKNDPVFFVSENSASECAVPTYWVYLRDEIPQKPELWQKDRQQTTLHVTGDNGVSLSIPLSVVLKKAVPPKIIELGRVQPGTTFPLPLYKQAPELKNLLRSKPFAIHVAAQYSDFSPILSPNKDSQKPVQWDGTFRWHAPALPERKEHYNAFASNDTVIVQVGNDLHPDALYTFVVKGDVDPVIDMPESRLGALTRSAQGSISLPLPSDTAEWDLYDFPTTPISTTCWGDRYYWWKLSHYRDVRVNGIINNPIFYYHLPVEWEHAGKTVETFYSFRVVSTSGETKQLRYKITSTLVPQSTRSIFSLEASMIHSGIWEQGGISQYQWSNRFGATLHPFYKGYSEAGTHYDMRVTFFLEGNYLSVSKTPALGIGARWGHALYPGSQRFWHIDIGFYTTYRYGVSRLDPENDPQLLAKRYQNEEHGMAFGVDPTVRFHLGEKYPRIRGLYVGAGLQLGGTFGAGVGISGLPIEFGTLIHTTYRFGL